MNGVKAGENRAPLLPASGGVLILDKPAGLTSHDAVGVIRRLYGTKQAGHTGTLDPLATGVLPVLVGRAVKASEYLLAEIKEYTALLQLGRETDTEDVTGRVLKTCETLPSKEEVFAVCAEFVGDLFQIPPMYSALKMDGKKLVDLARAGVEVPRSPRPITVYRLDVSCVDEKGGLYELRARCSKGTYVRTLCADIGRRLRCGGVMAALRRTVCGPFSMEEAHAPCELEKLGKEELFRLLLPVESLFEDLPRLEMPPFYRRLSSSGCEIYLKKIGAELTEGQRVRMCAGGEFYALGEVRAYPDGLAVKAVKQFLLFDKDGNTIC